MKRWNETLVVALVLGLSAALVVGCGGGRQRGGGTTAGGGAGGEGPGNYSKETQSDFARVFAAYEKAAQGGLTEDECDDLAGDFEEISNDSGVGVPEAIFNAGMIWDQCKNQNKARGYFERANKIAQEHSQHWVQTQSKAGKKAGAVSPGYAPAFLQLGIYAYRDGNKAQAKRMFEQARESDRRSTEAYTNLAILDRENRNYTDAQLNLRRALAVNSDYMTAFAQMALLYLEVAEENAQMLDIVVLVSQQAAGRAAQIKSEPLDLAPLHNTWGLALIRKGDVVGSAKQFDTARRLNPQFFEAHMNYGAVNLSFRGFEAAEESFRRAVDLNPQDYQAHLSLGSALRGLERYADARAEYEKARQIDAAAPSAYYNLAVLMQDYEISDAGDMNGQVAVLTKAKQMYRDFLTKCQGRAADCIRKRPGEPDQDMRQIAEKRIKACDDTISGLREAAQLAAEAARLEKQAAAEARAAEKAAGGGEKTPPPPAKEGQ